MTEIVKARQFDSEEGGGVLANFVGQIIYFLHSIGYVSRLMWRAFVKSQKKQTYIDWGGGVVVVEVQYDVSCLIMLVCVTL